jgi:hypothetical protein
MYEPLHYRLCDRLVEALGVVVENNCDYDVSCKAEEDEGDQKRLKEIISKQRNLK